MKKSGCSGLAQWKTRWKMWITLGNGRIASSFLCKATRFTFFTLGKIPLAVFWIFSLETGKNPLLFSLYDMHFLPFSFLSVLSACVSLGL